MHKNRIFLVLSLFILGIGIGIFTFLPKKPTSLPTIPSPPIAFPANTETITAEVVRLSDYQKMAIKYSFETIHPATVIHSFYLTALAKYGWSECDTNVYLYHNNPSLEVAIRIEPQDSDQDKALVNLYFIEWGEYKVTNSHGLFPC